MGPLFIRMVDFYNQLEWPMVQIPGEPILTTTYQGKNGQWVVVCSADDTQRNLAMFSRAPMACPPERMSSVIAFFTRINFGMLIGAWVVDTSDGEIRFRIGQDARAIEITPEVLQRMTLYMVMTMDHYLPALRALLDGDTDPVGAYELVFPPDN